MEQNHVNIMRDVFLNNKHQAHQPDTKFQTLPHNTKLNKTDLISSKGSTRESISDSSPPAATCDGGRSDINTVSIHVNGFGKHVESPGRQSESIQKKDVNDVVDRQVVPSQDSSDWHKVRRRGVIVDDDMERALSAPMSHNSSPEPESKLIHKTSGQKILSSGKLSPPPVPSLHDHQDISCRSSASDGIFLKNRSDHRRDENGNESSDGSHTPQTNCLNGVSLNDKPLPPSSSSTSSPSSSPSSTSSRDDNKLASSQDSSRQQSNGYKQPENCSKGNLKNGQHSQSNGNSDSSTKGLTRRVSFDPLALLLDAALEGELELVKKTACQVSVCPSFQEFIACRGSCLTRL